MNFYVVLNKHLATNNFQYSYSKKKRKQYIRINESNNDNNLGEFTIRTDRYYDGIRLHLENKVEFQFKYSVKKDFPDFIRNFEYGANAKISIVNMRNGEVVYDEFYIPIGSMFRVIYEDNYTLYLDIEHTNVYGSGIGSIEPVNENLTLYMRRN